MRTVAWIFLGGGLGSLLRFLLMRFTHHSFGEAFPYGTLLVNSLGSFVIGYLAFALSSNELDLRAFLMIGLLGGFTTFSTFSLEVLDFFENGQVMRALITIVLSVTVALVAAWGGAILGRK